MRGGEGRCVCGRGERGYTFKVLTTVFDPQYILHNYYCLTSSLPSSSGKIIFSPWFILSLGSKLHGIPEWPSGRELRGMRCRFYPSQNLSRLWGSRIARLNPISKSGSLSPPWACAWSPRWLLHPVPSITWKMHKASILWSVCHLHPQVLANVRSPPTHASQERCSLLPRDSQPSFPLVNTRTQWTEASPAQGPGVGKQRGLKKYGRTARVF